MVWIISNIDLIIGIIILAVMFSIALIKFIKMGRDRQLNKIKEWLLYAVVESEKTLGEKTGQIKLRYAYDMFITKFKFISLLITFDQFSLMVDESLEKMRKMLEQNDKLKEFVEKK